MNKTVYTWIPLSFHGVVLPLRWTEGATAIGDDTFLIILYLTENSTQAKITSIRVQYVVPGFHRKGQDGGPEEHIPQLEERSRACRPPHEGNVLPGQRYQRLHKISKTGDKPPVISHESQKLLDTLQAVWDRSGLDVFYFLRVAFQSTPANDMAQERHRGLEQMTFGRFQL